MNSTDLMATLESGFWSINPASLVNISPCVPDYDENITGQIRLVHVKDSICENMELVFSIIGHALIGGLGCVINMLAIATLQKCKYQAQTIFLLSGLSICDFAFLMTTCVLTLVVTCCQHFQSCAQSSIFFVGYVEQYREAIIRSLQMMAINYSVLTAIHRYICICAPWDVAKYGTIWCMKKQIGFVLIITLLYNLPRYFEFKILAIKRCVQSGFSIELTRTFTTFGQTASYQILYKNVSGCIIMYGFPLLTLTAIARYLVGKLRVVQICCSRRPRHTLRNREERLSLAYVNMNIVVVFLICQTPLFVKHVMLAVKGQTAHQCGHVYYFVSQVADLFILLNSSLNFLIYMMYAPSFRRAFLSQIKQPFLGHRSGPDGSIPRSKISEGLELLSGGNLAQIAAQAETHQTDMVNRGTEEVEQEEETSCSTSTPNMTHMTVQAVTAVIHNIRT